MLFRSHSEVVGSKPTGLVSPDRSSCAPAPALIESPSEINNKPKQEVSKLVDVEEVSPREGLASLNGTAYAMISDIAGWMHNGDEQCAKTWLASTIQIYGDQITKQAYHKLGTDMAEGRTFARPLQTWTAIARRMQHEGNAGREDGADKRKAMLAAQREKIRQEQGWVEESADANS